MFDAALPLYLWIIISIAACLLLTAIAATAIFRKRRKASLDHTVPQMADLSFGEYADEHVQVIDAEMVLGDKTLNH